MSSFQAFDGLAPTPANRAQEFANAVLVSRAVLEVGGGITGNYGTPVEMAEVLDPRTETWTRPVCADPPPALSFPPPLHQGRR